ncbi:RPII140-upstream gene protein-like isoform X2 [Argiope bruennichi]|uniref:Complex I assembly factor TIMMDC1, mitochondrial n=2 Tax=Argiope bruennichi TaxID=94029 RepID=A0A8T0EBP0_ARGBR|nr:RPII140-upstream gene protein-like isoform X2 [Argiope bruennichi]XP_055953759.1 RPII140-upstream gene protein-like isoform X2 [Argiope bruennichi]KAF8770053.1 RPII140-upstream protein like [Argiope bruennichi]
MNYVITTGKYTIIVAAAFGGFASMMKAKEDFFRKNKAKSFESQHLAKRSLTNEMTMALLQGGTKSALKYGSFCSFYLLSTMTAANYRNKISVWEHAVSGAVLGGFSRINYGLKGFAVAGVLGGFLGLIAGGLITMGTGGMTMDEFRCWLHEEHYLRLKQERLKEGKETS